ncbi:uncharacterized protein DS421_18g627900 [Arachis hypogaea]|nr:uncharacterized protein DS421_18g627900 [Arachis hypogaea]
MRLQVKGRRRQQRRKESRKANALRKEDEANAYSTDLLLVASSPLLCRHRSVVVPRAVPTVVPHHRKDLGE